MNEPAPQSDNATPVDQELSPEAEAALKKAKRAFGSGLLIMILGLLSVLGVMIYKLNTADEPVADNTQVQSALPTEIVSEVRLPSEARVMAASATGNVISITFELNSQMILRLVDAQTGAILQDITLQ